jgi:hypothetical protein
VDLFTLANTAAGGGSSGIIPPAGDIGGTTLSPTVAKLQGTTLAAPSGGATAFLNATGNWTTPAGGGGSNSYIQPSGDTTGAADVTALQNALTAALSAGYGRVKGQPGGHFYLNAQLVIGSQVELDMTDCTITEVAATNKGFVRNKAGTAAFTAADGAISSGSSTVTTSLGASAVVGQTVTVNGATAGGANILLTGLVSAKTSTTITFTNLDGTTLTAGATVSSATVALYNRDNNITIRGGYWLAGANQPNIIGNFCVCHCDTYTIELQGFQSTIAGYCVMVFDNTNGRASVRNLNTTVTGADGIHVTGPHYGLVIPEATGTTGDDTVSLTASDFPNPGTGETSGNIIGVKIGAIDTVTAESALKIIAGAGNLVDDIVVYGGIRGNAANAIWIGDAVAQASTTGGNYGFIDLGTCELKSSANFMVNLISPAAEYIRVNCAYPTSGGPTRVVNTSGTSTVTIKKLLISGNMSPTGGPTVQAVYHAATSVTLDHVVFDKFNMDLGSSISSLYLGHGATICNQVDLIGCRVSITLNGYVIYTDTTTGTLGRVNIIGGEFANACLLQYNHNGAIVTTFSGGAQFTGNYVCQTGGTGTKTFVFGPCVLSVSGVGDAAVVWTNAATCLLQGDGLILSGALLHRNVGSESIEVKGANLPVDLSALIRTGNGDMANNTNGALGAGVGVAISSGSGAAGSWKNLFSGSTY